MQNHTNAHLIYKITDYTHSHKKNDEEIHHQKRNEKKNLIHYIGSRKRDSILSKNKERKRKREKFI